ncbi:hypothetical protein JL720_13622 [Aureococcus anophagefferens]|nr:hypothetical protein JL720_13622 [Aureococcus anophagefferens]
MVHPFEAALGALPSERAPEASFMESQPIAAFYKTVRNHVEASAAAGCARRQPERPAPASWACLGDDAAGSPDDAPLELVAFLASHVGSEDRVAKLARRIPGFAASRVEGRASQFEHFSRLAFALGGDGDGAWVLSSDDDDVWHPDRATAYRAAADAARADASCVVCSRLARPAGGAAAPADAARRAVAAGRAATTPRRVLSYCCRRRVLDAFFAVATEDLRRCQYCDVAWYRYLTSREASRAFAPRDARNWLYFYDKTASGASARVEVREQHRAVARRVADLEGAAPSPRCSRPRRPAPRSYWLRPTHRDALFFAASNFGVAFEAEATARGDYALE